jgi:hypothetical protein
MITSVWCIAFHWQGDNEVEWLTFTKSNKIALKWSFIKDTDITTLKIFAELFPLTGYGRPNEWMTVPLGKWLVFADTQAFPQLADEIRGPE